MERFTEMAGLLKRVVAIAIIVLAGLSATIAVAQSIHYSDMAKVPPAVMEKAKQGISQDLIIVLDAKEIDEREERKRATKGLKSNDPEIQAETVKEIDDLKATVFPNGKLGDAAVIHDFRSLALLFVRVPNLKALARILAHPKVKAVQPNDTVRPALTESLPLIGQSGPIAAGMGAG